MTDHVLIEFDKNELQLLRNEGVTVEVGVFEDKLLTMKFIRRRLFLETAIFEGPENDGAWYVTTYPKKFSFEEAKSVALHLLRAAAERATRDE